MFHCVLKIGGILPEMGQSLLLPYHFIVFSSKKLNSWGFLSFVVYLWAFVTKVLTGVSWCKVSFYVLFWWFLRFVHFFWLLSKKLMKSTANSRICWYFYCSFKTIGEIKCHNLVSSFAERWRCMSICSDVCNFL